MVYIFHTPVIPYSDERTVLMTWNLYS